MHASVLKANQKLVHKLYTASFLKAKSQEDSRLKLSAEFRAQSKYFSYCTEFKWSII